MIYTASSLRAYDDCPEKFRLKYREMVDASKQPIGYRSTAMQRGQATHEAIEYLLGGGSVDGLYPLLSPYPPIIQAKVIGLLKGRYIVEKEWGYPGVKTIFVEKVLECTIQWYRRYSIAGKLDAMVWHQGSQWIVDHKTSERWREKEYYERGIQPTFYMELARRNGYEPIGVLIHFLRMPSLRQRKTETITDYENRIVEDVVKVSRTGTHPGYFGFHEIRTFHPGILRRKLSQVYNDSHHNPNLNSCYRNSPCEFIPICDGSISLEHVRRLDERHPELRILK